MTILYVVYWHVARQREAEVSWGDCIGYLLFKYCMPSSASRPGSSYVVVISSSIRICYCDRSVEIDRKQAGNRERMGSGDGCRLESPWTSACLWHRQCTVPSWATHCSVLFSVTPGEIWWRRINKRCLLSVNFKKIHVWRVSWSVLCSFL